MVWASFLDAELEASEGNFENGRVATVTPHGGATPGVDYVVTDISSQLTFKPGQTEQSFCVAAINDDIDDEYLMIGFGMPLPERVLTGRTTTTRINLVDDDVPEVEVSFAQSSYEVTSTYRVGSFVSAKIDVTVRLSANPKRFVNMGIVAESTLGDGGIYFGCSANVPRGARADQRRSILRRRNRVHPDRRHLGVERVRPGPDQTYRLSFGGLSHRVSAGSPATATITVNANT